MKKKDAFMKAFQEGHKCDFCDKEGAHIIRIILHPLYKYTKEDMLFSGYVAAHKCMECIEEEAIMAQS